MNKKQQAEYKKLTTIKEKAKYLLQFEITATTDLDDLGFVSRATIGEIRLPVTAKTDEEAIIKAKVWLKEKAA